MLTIEQIREYSESAIEKYICIPMDELRKGELKTLDETEMQMLVTLIMSGGRPEQIKAMYTELKKLTFVPDALERRQELVFHNDILKPEFIIMLVTITNANIGQCIMYLYYIQWYCHKHQLGGYQLSFQELFCKNIFAMGTFKEEDLQRIWEASKVHGEHMTQNLIDSQKCAASFIKKPEFIETI